MTSNKHNKKYKGLSRSVDRVRISKNPFGVVSCTKTRLNQTALARERLLSQARYERNISSLGTSISSLDAAARGCDNDEGDAKLKHDGMQGSTSERERRADVDVDVDVNMISPSPRGEDNDKMEKHVNKSTIVRGDCAGRETLKKN